jgi:hypothetical protein
VSGATHETVITAAAKAILTAQNANDNQPQWQEACHLATVALQAALPHLAATVPSPLTPEELAPVLRRAWERAEETPGLTDDGRWWHIAAYVLAGSPGCELQATASRPPQPAGDPAAEVEAAAASLITEGANQRSVHRRADLANRLDSIAGRLVDAAGDLRAEFRRLEAARISAGNHARTPGLMDTAQTFPKETGKDDADD